MCFEVPLSRGPLLVSSVLAMKEIDKRAKLYGSDVSRLSKGLCLLHNTNQQKQCSLSSRDD